MQSSHEPTSGSGKRKLNKHWSLSERDRLPKKTAMSGRFITDVASGVERHQAGRSQVPLPFFRIHRMWLGHSLHGGEGRLIAQLPGNLRDH